MNTPQPNLTLPFLACDDARRRIADALADAIKRGDDEAGELLLRQWDIVSASLTPKPLNREPPAELS
jgi:hypothetical protein